MSTVGGDFRTIYRVLRELHRGMDCEEFDAARISAESLGVSQARLDSILAMLAKEGYVEGVIVTYYDNSRSVHVASPRITLRGLEYLHENSLMRKAADAARGVVGVAL